MFTTLNSSIQGLKKNRCGGFTLIELLVVISIIGLLIAILLPALGAARKTAVQMQCVVNVRSIGQALAMYQTDNKQYFPYGQDTRNWPTLRLYAQELNRYLGLGDNLAADVLGTPKWHCPVVANDAGSLGGGMFGVYAYNPNLMGWIGGSGYSSAYSPFPSGNKNFNESDLRDDPSSIVTFLDGFQSTGLAAATIATQCPMQISIADSAAGQSNVTAPHFANFQTRNYAALSGSGRVYNLFQAGGRTSVYFLDGHARTVNPTEFPGGTGIKSWLVSP